MSHQTEKTIGTTLRGTTIAGATPGDRRQPPGGRRYGWLDIAGQGHAAGDGGSAAVRTVVLRLGERGMGYVLLGLLW